MISKLARPNSFSFGYLLLVWIDEKGDCSRKSKTRFYREIHFDTQKYISVFVPIGWLKTLHFKTAQRVSQIISRDKQKGIEFRFVGALDSITVQGRESTFLIFVAANYVQILTWSFQLLV